MSNSENEKFNSVRLNKEDITWVNVRLDESDRAMLIGANKAQCKHCSGCDRCCNCL